ncbi:uncharacterized protein [Solanum tuberosum]|uniref:Uncharacterized protein n=1 Tax=Solanum tuberosum TaxID=4113 RepID=M1BA54_SOLTU|nr:PREDICTED: uncharacterized protein LOC107058221 [Solanum tuberosum]XP_015159149.1 PREDICTED: uncharacterized protein LOC107058221 [Solanum tuberosum]
MDPSPFCSNLTKLFHLHVFHGGTGTRRFISRVLGHGRYTRESAECSKQCQISLYFGYVFQKYNVDEVSSTGYLITSCPKLQELTIECGVVGIAVESICYTILTSQINLVWCCEAVHYFIGFEMEMEFVKLILASTPALKEIFDG